MAPIPMLRDQTSHRQPAGPQPLPLNGALEGKTVSSQSGQPLVESWTAPPAGTMDEKSDEPTIEAVENKEEAATTKTLVDDIKKWTADETVGRNAYQTEDEKSNVQSTQEFRDNINDRTAQSKQRKGEHTRNSSYSSSEDEFFDAQEHMADVQAQATPKVAVRVITLPSPHIPKLKLKRSPRGRNHSQVRVAEEVHAKPTVGITGNTESKHEGIDSSPDSGSPARVSLPASEDIEESALFEGGRYIEDVSDTESDHNMSWEQLGATSIDTVLDMEADNSEYNMLKAKEAAGEPMILPKDVRDKLQAKVEADMARRRAKDPRYQYDLMRAKVDAAEAKRRAEIPDEDLYPVSDDEPSPTLQHENSPEVGGDADKAQIEVEQKEEPVPPSDLFGQYFENDDGLDGNYEFSEEVEHRGKDLLAGYYVVDPAHPGQYIRSMPNGAPTLLSKLAILTGKLSLFKRNPKAEQKPKGVDQRSTGWTMADILEEDVKRLAKGHGP